MPAKDARFERVFRCRFLDSAGGLPSIYLGMEQTLLLNATYEPLKVVHWQKALTLFCQGKVEVISVYDREVHSVSVSFRLPSVIRLLRLRPHQTPDRLRAVLAREHLRARQAPLPVLRPLVPHQRPHLRPRHSGRAGRPQGLGEHRHLLRDVQPAEGRTYARGGRDAAASATPRRPDSAPSVRFTIGLRHAPESWRDYLYWNVELDDT